MSRLPQTEEPRPRSTRQPSASRYRLNPSRHGTHGTLLRVVGDGGRTLDVGCATGYLGVRLAQQGCELWGVDRDEAALEEAAPHYRDVQALDLEAVTELPWPPASFDTILAADVLEHLRDPEPVLRLLRRSLRPGGRLVASFPNVAHVSVRAALLAGSFRYRDTGILDRTHLRLFTFRSARELVTAAGFRVEALYGGSDRFGPLVNAPLVGPAVRGLLAFSIVVVARPA